MNKIVPRSRTSIWKNAIRIRTENDRPVLSRLIGLETEFAIRYMRKSDAKKSERLDFAKFLIHLADELPIAPSFRNPNRVFLANGGCVSFEHAGVADSEHGMLECATPECRSPRELLCYQVALESLISDSVKSTFSKNDALLIKGSADAHGHTFGQHESYDVTIGRGLALLGWRIGLVLMLPMLILYQMMSLVWFLLFWGVSQIAMRRFWTRSNLTEDEIAFESGGSMLSSRWLDWCAAGLRVLHMPIAMALWLNIYWFALLPQRRHMSGFFASRCIVDGAGFLDRDNRFWISGRSATVNSIIGFGSYRNERPIFRCDSWLRGLCTDADWTFRFYRKLFRSRQRIEIAIGDSGLCEQSQYVRLGATSLVFDLVELAACTTPRLKNPIYAIQRFAKDWMLLASAPDRARRQWTALELQHGYAACVRAMLQAKDNVPLEAWKILDQWQTTLNQLRPTDDELNLPRSMLGRVDWLSKLWLIHQMKSDSAWAVRKKIDLRYHELSDEGYHFRLNQMLGLAPLLMADEKSRARRNPPAESPALKRGYLIREFSESDSQLRVDWTHAELVLEGRLKRVVF